MGNYWQRLRNLLLGSEKFQRLLASQSLLVLAVYLAFAVVQHIEVIVGLIDESASWPLTAWNLLGGVGFYAVIRSGMNQRIARGRARALVLAQSAWALVGIAWSYAITGPARGAVILIMLVVLIFGVFTLSAAHSRWLVAAGFGLLATVMVFKASTDPARYDPRVETVHLVFAAIVMLVVSNLAVRIGTLRRNLEQRGSELAQALQRIQALAHHDELTGLANRRAALERMQQIFASRPSAAAAAPPAFSVALVDIDHFKRINDELGHAAGDEVLRRVAATGRAVVREGDLLARWGGEEFLLVMPCGDARQVVAALGRWKNLLQQQSFDDLAPGWSVSFSAGVAECLGSADLETAVARADAAMYGAKRNGRNRFATSEMPRQARARALETI